MHCWPTLAWVAVINTGVNILQASSWSTFLGLNIGFMHLTCYFYPTKMNLLQLWWLSGKIPIITRKGWWNGNGGGKDWKVEHSKMREIGDSDHKHLILLRIQLKALEVALWSHDWYFPVSNQTWAQQNLWWENIDLEKYMIEGNNSCFCLEPFNGPEVILKLKPKQTTFSDSN